VLPALVLLTLLASGVRPPATRGQQPLDFGYGVACGEASATEAVLWTRASAAASVVPELLDGSGQTVVQSLPPVQAGPDTDFTVHAVATGLTPGSTVHYRFRGPAGELSATGTCRTAPPEDADATVTFAFSGDADWKWRPYPLVRALNREPLDFFVFLGDLIYETTNDTGTTVVEDLDGYRGKYRENRERPDAATAAGVADVPLRDMYESFGEYMVFDNHETGLSAADPKAPRYTEGGAPAGDGVHQFVNQTQGYRDRMQAYSEYQPIHVSQVSGTGDPRLDGTQRFYYNQRWGKDAELFVVDDRSYRDVRLSPDDNPQADDPQRTMLGAPQLDWLEQALLGAKLHGVVWKFVVISSPIQQFGRASEIGADVDSTKSWAGGYRVERDRLLQFIDQNAIDNVVFLTTDDHATKINNLRYHAVPGDNTSPLLPARNAFEILTGPLGADQGFLPIKAATDGLSGRDADRVEVQTLVGDVPNTDGVTRGQKQAGLDPIGLEADFPGLVASSVVSQGTQPGEVVPWAFAAFNSNGYAVLTADATTLNVRVMGIPFVPFKTLYDASGQQAYGAETPQQVLSFQVRAQ
jgi:phosphodiesterase/alkaline phosphatase D-like protein